MRYFVGGEGPPLILVHGLGGAAANWTELAPLLAPNHRLLVPDLPGHGGSEALPAVSGLEPFADRVALLAAREGMLPAPVVGHSLGGAVVLRLALRHPYDVSAIVLAAAAGLSLAASGAGSCSRCSARFGPAAWRRAGVASSRVRSSSAGSSSVSCPSPIQAR